MSKLKFKREVSDKELNSVFNKKTTRKRIDLTLLKYFFLVRGVDSTKKRNEPIIRIMQNVNSTFDIISCLEMVEKGKFEAFYNYIKRISPKGEFLTKSEINKKIRVK